MRYLGIDHVQIAMPAGREAEAREFYAGILGLTEVSKPAELAGRGGAWFEGGRVRIHLGVDPDFRPARKAHPALVVDDIEAAIVELRRHGHEVATPERLKTNLRTFVHDPFGNRIELMQRDEPPR